MISPRSKVQITSEQFIRSSCRLTASESRNIKYVNIHRSKNRTVKRLLFITTTLLLALSAKAEVRGYGGITLDFTRAKNTGKSIIVPGKNEHKQKIYVAVACERRIFNSTQDEMKWGEWSEPKNIFESRIVSDICNFI